MPLLLVVSAKVPSYLQRYEGMFQSCALNTTVFNNIYLRILDFRQLWTPPRGKFSDLSARLLPEIFDRIAFERELKGNFAS